MGTNTETNDWKMCREWGTLEHSALNGESSSNHSPQSLGTYVGEDRKTEELKVEKDHKETVI